MRLRYVFSELGQGLRRNLSMHIAVVLTLFVSMTLVGLGVLINQQADDRHRATRQPAPDHGLPVPRRRRQPGPARRGHRRAEGAIVDEIEDNPEVADYARVQGGGLREGQGAATARTSSTDRTRP